MLRLQFAVRQFPWSVRQAFKVHPNKPEGRHCVSRGREPADSRRISERAAIPRAEEPIVNLQAPPLHGSLLLIITRPRAYAHGLHKFRPVGLFAHSALSIRYAVPLLTARCDICTFPNVRRSPCLNSREYFSGSLKPVCSCGRRIFIVTPLTCCRPPAKLPRP